MFNHQFRIVLGIVRDMTSRYSIQRGVGAGALSGAVAGAVMLPVMMATNTMMGNPPLAFQIMTGTMMGQTMATAAGLGIVLHMVASIIIGTIFGAVTSTDKLRLTSFAKGIGLGITTGIIAFAVLFLPMMMTVLPPQMVGLMHMMNPQAPIPMLMKNIQAAMPMIVSGALFVHIVFGAVLGGTAIAILRTSKSYECGPCHMKFRNERELHDHAEQHHTQKH